LESVLEKLFLYTWLDLIHDLPECGKYRYHAVVLYYCAKFPAYKKKCLIKTHLTILWIVFRNNKYRGY